MRIAHWALCLALASCGARRLTFPTDRGQPFNDFAAIHAEVAKACAGVRTLTAELSLAGRAGAQRLRGRVVSGFERPASMRLEGVAPFGPPAFILAARDGMATLLLPRDNAVLRNARPEEILGALTGVNLAPADLQAILTGCVEPAPVATAARTHAGNWASVELRGGAVLYLQRDGARWHLRGARRDGWDVEYGEWQGAFPRSVRLRSAVPEVAVDLTAVLAQLETNVDVPSEAFTVTVPPGAEAISLEELRSAGPLREIEGE